MRTGRQLVGLLLAAAVLTLCASDCCTPTPTPTCADGASAPTEGCDEFRRVSAKVFWDWTEHKTSGWYQLSVGDVLSTDADGLAELNFSECKEGHFWIFDDSSGEFQAEGCDEAGFDETSLLCVSSGAVYSGKCLGEFTVSTGSLRVTEPETSFAVVALPENRLISLVVVLEGRVMVQPVLSYNPTRLSEEPRDVEGGQFYFTMPNVSLSPVAGLEPRGIYPLDQLAAVTWELGIVDWMRQIGKLAAEDGVLPDDWPELSDEPAAEPEPAGYAVTSGGGWLSDARVQEALYHAVDWQVAGRADSPHGGPVTAYIGGEPVDALGDLAYDPERSRAMFEEMGYDPAGQGVVILYPGEDRQLEEAAQVVARYLRLLPLEAVTLEAVPEEEAREIAGERMAKQEPVLVLWR